MQLARQIITNILMALYQPFWFALLLAILASFLYLYCYDPVETGGGLRKALLGWEQRVRRSPFFRRVILLAFCTALILFRTLLNRNMWANPLSDVMGGWWIWKTASDGTVTLATDCIENVIMMAPFTFLLLLTFGDRVEVSESVLAALYLATKAALLFSLSIETLQLLLRLGNWQLADLVYNTLGGALGGLMYGVVRRFGGGRKAYGSTLADYE